MAESWAISSLDLHLDVSGPRVREGLERALRDAVRNGHLGAGTRLPSSRALAADLGIARNTVADAYGQLVAEGWLTARVGAGTRVAARPTQTIRPEPNTARAPRRTPYDLRAGTPTLASFPRTGWMAAARRAVTTAPADVFGYGDPRGLPVLRQALTEYLARARGVHASPERIVICPGFGRGLELLAKVLRQYGSQRVAMEAYGHAAHHELVRAAGPQPQPVPIDDDGVCTESLAGCDAVVLTPAHQFPLGMALAPHRRTRVVEWARQTGGLVIEDDYDGEFRYDRHPVGALQALAPDHVVYAGTASKTLAPGLRLGWMVLPPDLVEPVVQMQRRAGGQAGVIDQVTLAEYLGSGSYDRHVRRCRLAYRRRRDRLLDVLRRRAPHVRVGGVAAGLHAVLELPPGGTEDEVIARGQRHGVALEGLAAYRAPGVTARSPALVLGYATPPDHAYTTALARLGATLAA